MELQGKCIVALPIESGTSKSGNAWQKRNFVIETAGQYPKKVQSNTFALPSNEVHAYSAIAIVKFSDIDNLRQIRKHRVGGRLK